MSEKPGAADTRILQTHIDDDDEDGQCDEQEVILLRSAERKAKNLRRPREFEGAKADRIDQRDALRPVGDIDRRIQVVEENADDFAETEGDDGQIVAAQLECRRAEHHAGQTGEPGADGQDGPDRPVQTEVRTCQQRPSVGADSVERDVAKIEQAGQADDDVEAKRQEDVEDGEIENTHPGLPAHRGDEGQGDQESSRQGDSCGRPEKLVKFHARSPVFSPNKPDGLNISTTMSTTKAKMS